MSKIRIFIVDDSIAARAMLRNILSVEEDFEIVGEAGTAQGSIATIRDISPDMVILEATVTGGIRLEKILSGIKRIDKNIKIILSVDAISERIVMPSYYKGADDFISKPYKKESIIRTIRENLLLKK